ncbi:MAG: class I SAM-dependent methyltransferase [Candidatus Brocadia sp.]|nr:class I SAM-dependent methyltransferase [Candidatus Brocadia sp.]
MKSDINNLAKQKVWESYSLSYDIILPKLPFYQEVIKRHVEVMMGQGITDVIDIGAGTGNVSVELLSKNRRVTAVDLNATMLARLREKTFETCMANLSIIEQNAEDLSQFADRSFDGVTIMLALYDMINPRLAFHEAVRILRPGGSIVITEIKRCFQLQILINFVEEYLRQKNLYAILRQDWERVMTANKLLDPGSRELRLFAEEIESNLRENGFSIHSIKDSHLGNCATIWATKVNTVRK